MIKEKVNEYIYNRLFEMPDGEKIAIFNYLLKAQRGGRFYVPINKKLADDISLIVIDIARMIGE